MAEAVVFNVAKNILDQLLPLARQKIEQLWGVETELEKLQRTVSTIQAVLLHAEEQYHQSQQVKDWVVQLKDALYDAEDLLGVFYIESQLKDLRSQNKIIKEVSTFFSTSNQLVLSCKMASKLQKVNKKINAIKDARNFHLDERLMDREVRITTRREEKQHSFIREQKIIGRDVDKGKIKKLLMQDSGREENISMVSIIGIGGLGKTALAQYVFNEEDVKKHFEPRMWITVSDDFDIKKIVGKIIASAKDAERPEHLEMDQMQNRLRKEIDGKRYLLVLDDLWNEDREEWLKLKDLLDGGGKGSKILITTRASIVADTCGVVEPHVLKGLTASASLDLLMRCASSEGQNIPESEKASIGKDIVEKCCGVPLAIRVIGGMLFLKKTKAEWSSFKNNDLHKLPQRENDITAVLRISYDHLPSHLKQCFAFCSLFPKDCEIRKSALTSLWIAEGFIQPSSGEDLAADLEQKARDSFLYLLHRGFFQDRVDDEFGNVIVCKMHDLMHDLACQVAGTECDEIGPNGKGTLRSNTIRHLSYSSDEILLDELSKLQPNNKKLRTLISTDAWFTSCEIPRLKLMSSLKYLRALTLQGTNMKVVPSFICKLKLLSYLDLSYNGELERLPNSIKSLQNLTTLILIGCYKLKGLPKGIVKLVRLVHLHLHGYIDSMPRGLEKFTSLCTLTHFTVREDSSNRAKLNELSSMTNLRGEITIGVVGYIKNATIETERANLKAKQFLDTLRLSWRTPEGNKQNEVEVTKNHETLLEGIQPHENLRKLCMWGYEGARFPRWMMEDIALYLPNLVEVQISGCKRCRYLPALGLLPRLKKLVLEGLDEVESISNSGHESTSSNLVDSLPSFPCLIELEIVSCFKLKSLPSMENVESLTLRGVSAELVKQSFHPRRLRHLNILTIESLESLPDWLQHCTTLETLEVGDLTSSWNRMDDLTSLRTLEIILSQNLTSIPESITQLKSLEHLQISDCDKLMALPDRMGDLVSLRTLEIKCCPNLTSFPESMTQLKSLKRLEIYDCLQLEDKCRGGEWYKIKHIPYVILGGKLVR